MTQDQPSSPTRRCRAAVWASACFCCALACSDDGTISYTPTDGVAGASPNTRNVITSPSPGEPGTSPGAAGTPGFNTGGSAGVPGTGGFAGVPGTGGVAGFAGASAGDTGNIIDLTDDIDDGASGAAGTAGSPGLGAAGSSFLAP